MSLLCSFLGVLLFLQYPPSSPQKLANGLGTCYVCAVHAEPQVKAQALFLPQSGS